MQFWSYYLTFGQNYLTLKKTNAPGPDVFPDVVQARADSDAALWLCAPCTPFAPTLVPSSAGALLNCSVDGPVGAASALTAASLNATFPTLYRPAALLAVAVGQAVDAALAASLSALAW